MIIDLKEVKPGETIELHVNGVKLFVGIAYNPDELMASEVPLSEVFDNTLVKSRLAIGGITTVGEFWKFFFDNGSDIWMFSRKINYLGGKSMSLIEEYIQSVTGITSAR